MNSITKLDADVVLMMELVNFTASVVFLLFLFVVMMFVKRVKVDEKKE